MDLLEIFLLFGTFFIIIRPIYTAYLFTRPPRIRVRYFTPTTLGVTYHDVQLSAADGAQLHGWYIPSHNGAAILLLHGHGGNRLGMVHHAEALIRAGYGVLMLDLRAHGDSSGKRFGRGQVLVDDALTAVAYLRKRPDLHAAGIGIAGVSIGGLIALQSAAQTVAIRAVFMDGPSPARFSDLPPTQSPWQWLRYQPQRLYMRAEQWFWRRSSLPANHSVLPKLAARPLFIVATGKGVEQEIVRHLAELAAGQITLMEIPAARHAQGWYVAGEEYTRRMVAFFDAHLQLKDKRRVVLPDTLAETPDSTILLNEAPGPQEATVSMTFANLLAILFMPLSYLIFIVPFRLLWQRSPFLQLAEASTTTLLALFAALAVGALLHEGLHLWGFIYFGDATRAQIKIGFNWRGLAPFAHCEASLSARAYRSALLLPGILLGLLPSLLGLISGLWWLVVWGSLMVVAAGGDAAVFWALRGVDGHSLVRDHPTAVGCTILSPDE